jgi:Zn-dependent peptidase ImmA (M78 family)
MAETIPGELANTILHKCDVKSAPVPIEKVAESLGAQIRLSPLDESLSGMIFIRGDTPVIGVNSRHHPNRRRFTIAHEIAHLLLHRDLIGHQIHVDRKFPVLMRDGDSAAGTKRMEIQANQLGAELLMPSFLLTPMLKRGGFDIDDEEPLTRLARKFRVSRQALEFRIRNMGLAV